MQKKYTYQAFASLMLAIGLPAYAGEQIDLGNDLKFDWRLNTSYSLAVRTKDRAPLLSVGTGESNGNNNFNKGALTANRVSGVFEGKLHKNGSGLVMTVSTFYDDVYHRRNDNDAVRNKSTGAPYNQFTSQTKRYQGGYTRLLDTYAFTSFDVGSESRATLKVGRQVVNWGEAVYFANISAAQGPFDGAKNGIPGTEVKESVLPEDQISASIEVTPKWSLLAQWQLGFQETILPALGAFLSTENAMGPGSFCLGDVNASGVCTGVPRSGDKTPSKTSQWGVGTRYRVTPATEVGVYYLNYNDRTPSLMIKPDYSSYYLEYFDNIKMLGATVSTAVGSVSAYGELTYRKGTPVLVGEGNNVKTVRGNVSQLNVGGFYNVGRTAVADDMQVLAEVSAVRVNSISGAYRFDDLTFKTRDSLAFSGTVALSYPGVAEGWELSVPLSYSYQIKGRSLVGTFGGGEGDHRYSIGATMVHKGNMSVNVTYLGYLGKASLDAKNNRVMTDRDQLSVTLKYSF